MKELTLVPVLNHKTSLETNPVMDQRQRQANHMHFHRQAVGKEKHEFMDKALDLRHIGKC